MRCFEKPVYGRSWAADLSTYQYSLPLTGRTQVAGSSFAFSLFDQISANLPAFFVPVTRKQIFRAWLIARPVRVIR
ncbi:MAG: hypothetical protein M1445_16570, partial [Bacteroidetes bacterium]|nr:hypothetical protein [Bacteroidota bacterium]